MCGGGASNLNSSSLAAGGNFIFPQLSSLKGSGAAAFVTKVIRDLSVLGDQFESTSLRCGASLTMVTHPTTSKFHACVRAGHDMKAEMGNTFQYYTQCSRQTVAVGGMALAGYSNSMVLPHGANLDFYGSLTENEQQRINNLMERLFYVPHIDWGTAKTNLYGRILATILKSLDDMISKYSMDNLMVKTMIKTAKEFGFEYKTLIYWGNIIQENFRLKNLPYQQPGCQFSVDPNNGIHKMLLESLAKIAHICK